MKKKMPLIVIGVVVAVILFFVLCTFVQRPYETIIVDRAGKIVEPVTLYRGWKLCLPTDRVTRIDTRNHLYTTKLTEMTTQDKRTVTVKTYAAWKIVDAEKFYLGLRDDATAELRVARLLLSTVTSQFSKHKLEQFFNAKTDKILTDDVEGSVQEEVNKELSQVGLEVTQVGFSRIAFPPIVANAVNLRMVDERKTEAAKERGEGMSKATEIRTKADVTSKNMVDKAQADAMTIRGEADKEAIDILGQVTKDPKAQEWYRIVKLSDLAKNTFTRGNVTLMLSSESPLVDMFLGHGPPAAAMVPDSPTATQPAKRND